jgi:branched-subunit amino acid transport protein AzlD
MDFMSFIPFIIIAALYSIFPYKVAEAKNENKWLAVLLTFLTLGIYLIYVLAKTVLYTLREVERMKKGKK